MSSSYSILGTMVVLLILFIYLSWIYVSQKHVWSKKETAVVENKNRRRWKNLVDKKNQELGWFDLGNHIIILGIVLFAIFIAKNA